MMTTKTPSISELTINMSAWRALIIDDEPDNLSLVEYVLGFVGVTTYSAKDGASGLLAVDSFKPTLILLDMHMPRMDGWEVHRRLRSRPELNDVPIVAVTALAMRYDEQRIMAAGFDGYITKPFRVTSLLGDLSGCVRRFLVKQSSHLQEPISVDVAQIPQRLYANANTSA